MEDRWRAVDGYIEEHLVHQDVALYHAASGIAVSPAQGKLLHLLARSLGARRILELGTLNGYSTIWLARALPADGELVSLEINAHHAARARENVDRAGIGGLVDIRVGPALEAMDALIGPFDLIFLDADKPGLPEYFAAAVELARPGSLIIADNTVQDGAVIDVADESLRAAGGRRLHEAIAADPRVDATGIQTVGAKGHDGFVLALVGGIA